MNFGRSYWHERQLVLTKDAGEDIQWAPGLQFDWSIGAEVDAPITPQYVFEPRPVDRIKADLEVVSDPDAEARLIAEQQLCDQPHVVYAAFYGTLPKVGMTSLARLPTRLREQGADGGFVIAHADDRAGARAIENAVTFQFKIPQWRTHRDLFPQWTRPLDVDRMQGRAEDLRKRLAGRYEPEEWIAIPDHPLPVLPAKPQRAQTAGHHAGTAIGAKGAYLVYASSISNPGILDVGQPRLMALRHTDLEGRAVEINSSDD